MTGTLPSLLTIPPTRRRWEAARALEIQEAEEALNRSRLRWFLLGIAVALLGYIPFAFAWHTTSETMGNVYFWTGILVTDIGPMVVLWAWARSEDPF